MANYQLITKGNYYIGATADTKPTSCTNGSRAYDYQTKTWYITNDGGSTWSTMQDLDALVLGAGTALVGKVGIDQATANANEVVVKSGTVTSVTSITNALPAGTNLMGKVGIDQTTAGTTNAVARTKATLLNSGVLAADTQIKAASGAAYWITISDTADLAITLEDAVGTGTAKWGIDLPAGGYGHFIFDPPIEFATGIYLNVSTVTCKVTVGYK